MRVYAACAGDITTWDIGSWRRRGLQDEATAKAIGDSSYNELMSRLIAALGSDAPPATRPLPREVSSAGTYAAAAGPPSPPAAAAAFVSGPAGGGALGPPEEAEVRPSQDETSKDNVAPQQRKCIS